MNISVFGAGYVGLVTATCFAERGNHVICVDIDKSKIDLLNSGGCPIYELGLPEMMAKNVADERLQFSANIKDAIKNADVIFIAVGTPPGEDGSANLQYVMNVAKDVGKYLTKYAVIVDKSTVPIGTADKVREEINLQINNRNANINFDIVSNPEFLKEGAAIDDCMKPDRIIIGTDSINAERVMRILYSPFNRNHERIIVMDIRSAELTKYAANAMLATKISFMNEMSQIAEKLGADIEKVRLGIGSDPRIGFEFIYPGAGFGGSCFPKDIDALAAIAKKNGYDAKLLQAVKAVNKEQKQVLLNKILKFYQGDIKGKTFAIWGLAFKPNTDDVREASSRVLIEGLWQHGAKVRVYDPEAMDNFAKEYGARDDLIFVMTEEEALENANALIIVTEWNQFRSPDFSLIKTKLKDTVIFDGRNLYDPELLNNLKLKYYSIGRMYTFHN